MCSVLVLVLSWLVSTPFRAVLALLGVVVLLVAASALAGAIKVAIGFAVAGAGERPDLTPFPNLDGHWIVELVLGSGLYVVSGITLWLLLARRRRVVARWLFVGYFVVQMFLQNFLFDPIDETDTTTTAPEAAMTRPGGGVSAPRFPLDASDRRPERITRNANGGRDQ